MILFPAIDLKAGACVRLVRGEMASATVFNDDPSAQARHFAEIGFDWLHVVDLDGAFAGRSVNGAAVRAIREEVDLRIQLGGGIRDRAAIDYWLDLGIDRIVLGTVALRDSALVRRAAADYPDRVVVGIDGRDGQVAVEGWAKTSGIGTVELARRAAGIAGFARQIGLPVIASGGIAALADIAALAAHASDGIEGAICGRALYDGSIDAKAALLLAAGEPVPC
jgi:phosphoribosylformimino-5-aminoimidazole carboxamide ribotide isomerase